MRPRARHVLFIVDQLATLGGGERVLLELARELPAHGYRCSLATLRPEIATEIRGTISCPLHVFALGNSYGLHAWRCGARLRRLIREQTVGIVQTFFESSDLWGGLHAGWVPRWLLAAGVRPALISSRRDMGILQQDKHAMLYRWINPVFDRVVAVSEAVRSAVIQRESLPPEKVLAIPNGLDLSRLGAGAGREEMRKRLGIAQGSEVIITVGNLRRVKGTDIFLRAAAVVAQRRPNAIFLVAGGDADAVFAAELRALAKALGLGARVQFLGEAPDVFAVLRASDLFCLLSRSEGMPNSLLEGMACGLPCIAARVGGVPEVICDGVDGLLAPPEDPAAAAASICALLAEPGKAQSLAARARDTVAARFSLDMMARRYVALYDHLLGLAPATPGEAA